MTAMRMRLGVGSTVLMLVLGVAGCRQPDGNVPALTDEEQVNKTGDIGRDLQNVAAGQPAAVAELRDDLSNLSPNEPPADLVERLSVALGTALAGKALSEEAAQDVAHVLFVVLTARQLSPRQIEEVQRELHVAVVRAGADEDPARNVSVVAGELQARDHAESAALVSPVLRAAPLERRKSHCAPSY